MLLSTTFLILNNSLKENCLINDKIQCNSYIWNIFSYVVNMENLSKYENFSSARWLFGLLNTQQNIEGNLFAINMIYNLTKIYESIELIS